MDRKTLTEQISTTTLPELVLEAATMHSVPNKPALVIIATYELYSILGCLYKDVAAKANDRALT